MEQPRRGHYGSKSAPTSPANDASNPPPSLPQRSRNPKTVRFALGSPRTSSATTLASVENHTRNSGPQSSHSDIRGYIQKRPITTSATTSDPDPALNTEVPKGMSCRYTTSYLLQFEPVFINEPSEAWAEKINNVVCTPPAKATSSAAPSSNHKYTPDFLKQYQAAFVRKPSEKWNEKLDSVLLDVKKRQNVKNVVGDTSEAPEPVRSTRRRSGAISTVRKWEELEVRDCGKN